tara:strand:- start:45531 stop:46652 length:1122 start_codon:yes stop_codon:yes gene_type:complete
MSNPTRSWRLLAAATVLALSIATDIATTQQQTLNTVLIVRCGPTDIEPNQGLLEALIWEPGATSNLTKAFGDQFEGLKSADANHRATHGTGTFQFHIACELSMTGPWDEKRRKMATNALVKHLQTRLDEMLYESPLTRLSKRRDELRNRHFNISANLLEMNAQLEQASQQQAAGSKQLAQLTEQLIDARLAVTTEQHVWNYLAKTREQNVAQRDQLRRAIQNATRERDTLSQELHTLAGDRAKAADSEEEKKLTAKIDLLNKRLDQIRNSIAERSELATDMQSMLTIILEQLPNSELALQRAHARHNSIQETLDRLAAEHAKAAEQGTKNSKLAIKVAQLQIDSQVTREQLLDAETQLSRIRPVQYEVLHSQQ